MATETKTILCGECNTPVNTVPNPKDDDVVTCPSCGNSDTLQNVMKIAQDFLQEQTATMLNKKMRNIARNSKIISVKEPFKVSGKKHRFKFDLEL